MTAKVLGECLHKNVSLGILEKKVFPETPPRVEYHFTEFGRRFLKMFAVVEAFQAEIEAAELPRTSSSKLRTNKKGSDEPAGSGRKLAINSAGQSGATKTCKPSGRARA